MTRRGVVAALCCFVDPRWLMAESQKIASGLVIVDTKAKLISFDLNLNNPDVSIRVTGDGRTVTLSATEIMDALEDRPRIRFTTTEGKP
jgi:hypothetical protein